MRMYPGGGTSLSFWIITSVITLSEGYRQTDARTQTIRQTDRQTLGGGTSLSFWITTSLHCHNPTNIQTDRQTLGGATFFSFWISTSVIMFFELYMLQDNDAVAVVQAGCLSAEMFSLCDIIRHDVICDMTDTMWYNTIRLIWYDMTYDKNIDKPVGDWFARF